MALNRSYTKLLLAVLAVSAGSAQAKSIAAESVSADSDAEAGAAASPIAIQQGSFILASGSLRPSERLIAEPSRSFAPVSRRSMDAARSALAPYEGSNIPVTAVTFRSPRRGPVIEVAAGSGEFDWAPDVAHVAMEWRF